MYQKVGKFLSEKSKDANYSDGYIDALTAYISEQSPVSRALIDVVYT